MILAAGRGERLKPLTDTCPKPLIKAQGKPLIVRQIEKLAAAGFQHLVINTAYLGEQIEKTLGNGKLFQPLGIRRILYSKEETALETGGGIVKALPLIQQSAQDQPFLVVNADVYTELDYFSFFEKYKTIPPNFAAILLNENPPHHLKGDFSLNEQGFVLPPQHKTYTYTGIGVFTADFFKNAPPTPSFPLKPLLENAISSQKLLGEKNTAYWLDVGSPARLQELDFYLKKSC